LYLFLRRRTGLSHTQGNVPLYAYWPSIRYYLVFVALNLLYSVLWNVFGVETRGRTLEELSEVFDANFPPRAALAKTTMLRREGGGLAGLDA
jgi:hypothetical protein